MARFRFGTLIAAGAVALLSNALHAQAAQAAQPAATPPAQATVPPVATPAVKPVVKSPAKAFDKPLWNQLTPAQKTALEPLHTEWDPLEGVRKQKWLEFTKSFATMNPEEQQRVHERMREWIKLTPDQRKVARQNFIQAKTIAPNEKSANWESYKQLPDAQKQKLAEQAAHKSLANLPAPKAAPHAGAPALHAVAPCPPGSVRNTATATPACVGVAASPATAPAPALATPPAVVTSSAPAR